MNELTPFEQSIFKVWKEYGHTGNWEECSDAFAGIHDSVEDFGYDVMQSCYDIPEYLESYINYEKYGRDLLLGGDYWSSENFYFRNF